MASHRIHPLPQSDGRVHSTDDFPLRRLGAIESDDGVRVDVDSLAKPCPWRWQYKACQKWDIK
jgi:hypothetical protein